MLPIWLLLLLLPLSQLLLAVCIPVLQRLQHYRPDSPARMLLLLLPCPVAAPRHLPLHHCTAWCIHGPDNLKAQRDIRHVANAQMHPAWFDQHPLTCRLMQQ